MKINAFHIEEGCMFPASINVSASPGGKINFSLYKERPCGMFSQMSVDLTKPQAKQLLDALTAELFPTNEFDNDGEMEYADCIGSSDVDAD